MRKYKIPPADIPSIIEELKSGKTFTEIALRYGCKAYTLQKRLKIYHPVGGRNTSAIWEIFPHYMNVIKHLVRKYRYINDICLFDIFLTCAYSLTVRELDRIKECSDKKEMFWKLFDLIRAKSNLYRKKIQITIRQP